MNMRILFGAFISIIPAIAFAQSVSPQITPAPNSLEKLADGYRKQVDDFFGDKEVKEFRDHYPFNAQIEDAMSLLDRSRPIYPRKGDLGDGLSIITGCRPHSCDDKAALVVDHNGNILVAATLTMKCPKNAPETGCRPNHVLSIYKRQSQIPRAAEQALIDWGQFKMPTITDIRHINLTK